jgi:amphi-Trp domain-containing protein
MARRELDFHAALTAEQVAEFLEKLAQSLREGRGTLKAAGRKLVLRPGQTVMLEVDAGSSKGQSWLQLELEWAESNAIAVEPGVEEEEEWEDEDEDEWEDEDWEDEEWYGEEEEDEDEERKP